MPKPTPFTGKRLKPLLASAAQTAKSAEETAGEAAPAVHVHGQSDISGLTSALAAKAADSAVVHKAESETVTGEKTHSADIKVSDKTKGLTLIDRTTDTVYRLFVDNGVLDIEVVA